MAFCTGCSGVTFLSGDYLEFTPCTWNPWRSLVASDILKNTSIIKTIDLEAPHLAWNQMIIHVFACIQEIPTRPCGFQDQQERDEVVNHLFLCLKRIRACHSLSVSSDMLEYLEQGGWLNKKGKCNGRMMMSRNCAEKKICAVSSLFCT